MLHRCQVLSIVSPCLRQIWAERALCCHASVFLLDFSSKPRLGQLLLHCAQSCDSLSVVILSDLGLAGLTALPILESFGLLDIWGWIPEDSSKQVALLLVVGWDPTIDFWTTDWNRQLLDKLTDLLLRGRLACC